MTVSGTIEVVGLCNLVYICIISSLSSLLFGLVACEVGVLLTHVLRMLKQRREGIPLLFLIAR